MWPVRCRQSALTSWVQRLELVSAHLYAAPASTSTSSAAARIEALVTQDEGGRGIAPLVVPGDLGAAAAALTNARRVGIITGFPCLITEEGEVRFASPQETDGPPGAVAIAKALLAQDTDVVILTDDVNASVVASCINAMSTDCAERRPELRSFPPRTALSTAQWQEKWQEMLQPTTGFDHLVAIERAGPATDGRYYTMSKKDMTVRGGIHSVLAYALLTWPDPVHVPTVLAVCVLWHVVVLAYVVYDGTARRAVLAGSTNNTWASGHDRNRRRGQ